MFLSFALKNLWTKTKQTLLVTILEKCEDAIRVRLPDQSFSGTTVVQVSAENLKEVLQVV
jgi:hypothetical protein